ncbi:hypothetical protein ACSBR2_003256 [Camellia fascicularis]
MAEEEDMFTKDETTDFRTKPALKKQTGSWKACPYILGNECCERSAYYGINTNLSSVAAVSNLTNWSGTCHVIPLIGAFLADAYLGRYRTIASFSIIHVFASISFQTTTNIAQHSFTNISLQSHKAYKNASTKGREAQEQRHEEENSQALPPVGEIPTNNTTNNKAKTEQTGQAQPKQLGLDDIVALNSDAMLFNIIHEALTILDFVAGNDIIDTISFSPRPGGSPLARLCQVIVASLRKFRVQVPEDNSSLLYETVEEESIVKGSSKLDHTNQLSLFDKAAVDTQSDHIKDSVDAWKLCTVTQVEKLKSIVRLLPIWATGIIFTRVYSQMGTLFVLQRNTMDLHMTSSFEIPTASLSLFDTVSVIFWVPVYNRVIVPFTRRLTSHKNGFTQLQQMAIGLVISIFAMFAAGTLALVRLQMVRKNNFYEVRHIPVSVFGKSHNISS